MHKKFDSVVIEKKWQEKWNKSGIYKTNTNSDKKKVFVLDMFPYPSGEGLHVGHPKGYIATDIYSRFKRMSGFEVLHPMGWDAFGLPAENYAIKNKVHPRMAVEKNVARFKEQLEILGFDYDWDKEINTTDPAFYKWTQWIFIQLLKKDLAYQSYEPINWCPGCQTGLANEDLESDGTCERCSSVVEKRPMRQWVLNIRSYADRMLQDLSTLTWPEHIKEAQRNWIGRSEGAEIEFILRGIDGQDYGKHKVKVFTTRPDTLFGVTFIALSPELTKSWIDKGWDASIKVRDFIDVELKERVKRTFKDEPEKHGVETDLRAVNPINGQEIPVWVVNYVLGDVGTGAIMAVPAHDVRDQEFASKFHLEKRIVVSRHYNLFTKTGVETINRGDTVDLFIEHPTNGTFLLQREKDDIGPDHVHFVGGGTDGEAHSVAIGRELLEETGFSNYEVIAGPIEIHTALAYRHIKNKNQRTKSHCYHIKLKNLEQAESEIEEGKHSVEWVTKDKIEKAITWEAHANAWNVFINGSAYTGTGKLINSGEFDGMTSEEAKIAVLEKIGGNMTTTYKIKDWVFSRQRYWGEPIPVVHTEDGMVYPIAEEQLPVTLPEVENYEPSGDGQSPLANIDEWVNVTGYVTDAGDFVVCSNVPARNDLVRAKRETNTMPQWAGSSWYYLRYIDPQNSKQLVNPEMEKKWQPVDVYVGGDHAVRHLIYARFWHKFLYDIGTVSTIEPFQRLEFLGFILAEDGRKMSKRWGNVINPDDIVKLVGADTMRVYEMFMGPFENTIAWSQDGLVGARRFLEKVNGLSEHITDKESQKTISQLHKTIKKVSEDIEDFKFNTAVSAMMIFINQAEKTGLSKESYLKFLAILAPFAPHLTEELWSNIGLKESVHLSPFPQADTNLAKDEEVTIAVQINGKMRGTISVSPIASETEVMQTLEQTDLFIEKICGQEIIKKIYVPGRILNLIITK